MLLVEQELLTLPEQMSRSRVSRSLIFSFMCMFCRSLFVLFLLSIMLSFLLRFTDSDYPFVIFNVSYSRSFYCYDSTLYFGILSYFRFVNVVGFVFVNIDNYLNYGPLFVFLSLHFLTLYLFLAM